MSFRRPRKEDSLDLLLDTMCNTFGGIILIAVLVTLLSRTEQKTNSSRESAEMLQRRISEAENTLRDSGTAHSNLSASASRADSKERLNLVLKKRALQAAIESASADAEFRRTNASPSAVDPAARMAELRGDMLAAAEARAAWSNELATAQQNTRRLQTRVTELGRQASATQEASVQKLRLPKERDTGRSVFNVIVQYGRIYPLHAPGGMRNTAQLSFTPIPGGSSVRPIPGAGLDPRGSEWRQTLNQLSSSRYYIGFYVFEDSFGAFAAARHTAVSAGFEFGWEPERTSDGPLKFGAVGTSPRAQ